MDKETLLSAIDIMLASLNWPISIAFETGAYSMTPHELEAIEDLLVDIRAYIYTKTT